MCYCSCNDVMVYTNYFRSVTVETDDVCLLLNRQCRICEKNTGPTGGQFRTFGLCVRVKFRVRFRDQVRIRVGLCGRLPVGPVVVEPPVGRWGRWSVYLRP